MCETTHTRRCRDEEPSRRELLRRQLDLPAGEPVRGNYPGSYTSSPSTPVEQHRSQFDWLAAGVGAAGMFGGVLLLAAVRTGARIARNRRHDVPLVVQIDDHPGVG